MVNCSLSLSPYVSYANGLHELFDTGLGVHHILYEIIRITPTRAHTCVSIVRKQTNRHRMAMSKQTNTSNKPFQPMAPSKPMPG